MILYTDAGTSSNGKRGHQKTTICVADENGNVVFERFIGDYTVNEGEILAIIAALKNVSPDERKTIYSDSKIAVNWTLRGWYKRSKMRHRRKVGERLNNRLAFYIDTAQKMFANSGSTITWIPRELNKAGWHLERVYKI